MAGRPGRIGEYRIERQHARRGACLEYEGTHLVLPRRAVIKVMAPTQPIAVSILREACILEALQHPGIVRVYESGLLTDRRPWFARELVAGATLASLLAPGALDRVDVISLLRDVAALLAHAHQRGVVHGNLRPDRIVRTGRSRAFPICIVDWSDARAHDATAALPVPTGASRDYTAPEVLAGAGIDDRADVFSLGVIAYRLLTGKLPFDPAPAGASGARGDEPSEGLVPTEVRCPDAPRELTGIVDQMLASDRRARPSSKEVHADLTWLAEVLAMPVAGARGLVRIRKPRWTPAVDFEATDIDGIAIRGMLDDDEPMA